MILFIIVVEGNKKSLDSGSTANISTGLILNIFI